VIDSTTLQDNRAPVETDSSVCGRLYGRAELGDLLCPAGSHKREKLILVFTQSYNGDGVRVNETVGDPFVDHFIWETSTTNSREEYGWDYGVIGIQARLTMQNEITSPYYRESVLPWE
jgi:hypothetical protein